eukprot:scaffold179139_cov30-Cyclotella_meneghiniana.AAC.1
MSSFSRPPRPPDKSIMTSNVVDFEDILNNGFSDANTAIRSGARARWERKKSDKESSEVENRKPF